MTYPQLKKTPIKEIVFSITFDNASISNVFESFVESKNVKSRFNKIEPILTIKIDKNGTNFDNTPKGYRLINDNEIIQIKEDSFSYHYLNKYEKFPIILDTFFVFLDLITDKLKEELNLKSITVRYINVLEIDAEYSESRLVQLFPKYSSDRKILNFQNSVKFNYNEHENVDVNIVTTKPNKDIIILDISAREKIEEKKYIKGDLIKILENLQEIKNKAFFDSITAKALIKYI